MKRHYYKPQMLVVKIVGRQQLLNSSGLLMNMPDYSQGDDGRAMRQLTITDASAVSTRVAISPDNYATTWETGDEATYFNLSDPWYGPLTATPTGVVYVALFPDDVKNTFHFTVSDGTNTYTGTKKAVLKEGKYYAVDIAVN